MEKENPLRSEKRRKLSDLREAGINPFPYKFDGKIATQKIREEFEGLETGEKRENSVVRIAGRVMTKRPMGKAAFFNIQDDTGRMQVYLRKQEMSEEGLKSFQLLDIGDIVGIEGFVFKTQKGELSVHAQNFEMLTKTIEPLPEKFHGLTDVELKYRQRHLDLVMDEESKKTFRQRSQIIQEIRQFLFGRGFMEVETPTLQPIYGGAAAYPFSTHHRALDMKLFLKISPEMYLKRLIVGGYEKVFEIGKNFRNEGVDRNHNPEFTMMEWYEAYTDYEYQMQQFEDLCVHLCKVVRGTTKFEYDGREIDFTAPWRRLSVYDGVKEYGGFDVESMSDEELLAAVIKTDPSQADNDNLKNKSRGELIMELFELTVEDKLWDPTFVIDFPQDISPLTKIHRSKAGLVERFEPIAAGMEIGNAYSELNDPEDQRERLEAQEAKRVIDEEAQPMDEDFVHAIEVGMPPTGGVGLGIDRLVMILTGRHSIRDVIFFPTMKHKE